MLVLLLFAKSSLGQNGQVDSLKRQLAIAKNDTSRILVISEICAVYQTNDFDSLKIYSKKGLALAQQVDFPKGEVQIMANLAVGLQLHGDMPQSLALLFKALQIAQERHLTEQIIHCLNHLGDAYWYLNDFSRSITYYKSADKLIKTANSEGKLDYYTDEDLNLGLAFLSLNMMDSAKTYVEEYSKKSSEDDPNYSYFLALRGQIEFKTGDLKKGFDDLKQSVRLNEANHDDYNECQSCYYLAGFFRKTGQSDSSIFYAKKGLAAAQRINYKVGILYNSKFLAEQYEGKVNDLAYYYLKLANSTNETLFGSGKVKELQKVLSEEQERQRQKEAERIAYQTRLKEYAFFAGLCIVLFIAFLLYRNNLREKRGKKLLEEKNELIENTLADLKFSQTQLIHSEKMASLGELTAGIAHEIQNPLNFVNNFSEVNEEMIVELEDALNLGNIGEALAIAGDMKENEKKISQHGKRADSIVKSMLEHSRTSTGEKQRTDLNELCDQFLKLSYYGERAKDDNFNAELITHFDKNLPKANVSQQEIGQVLLNLFNNAFYAVKQKLKTAEADYKPEVSVTSTTENGNIIIKVKDNGNGIPDAIKDKIMQPFFTTKPTGDGTGLGLSLSYDIVVKGHGGSVMVNSREGEGAEFIVKLPI